MAWTPPGSDLYQNDALMWQNPVNTGIGDWWHDKGNWVSLRTGENLTQDQIKAINQGQNLNLNSYRDGQNPFDPAWNDVYDALSGYKYHGADGKDYLIGGGYRVNAVDPESAATNNFDYLYGGPSGLGRQSGERSYSVTGWKGINGDAALYAGSPFDFYDKDGKYVGGQIGQMTGDKGNTRMGIMAALAMLGGAAAGGAFGGAAAGGGMGGAGAGGTTFGVVDSGLAGVGLPGGAGAAGAGAGAGALDLGGGVTMGADGAIGGSSALGTAGSGMSNAAILESVGAGGLGTAASSGATTGLLSKLGLSPTMVDAAKIGLPLLSAAIGSQPQQQTTTTTKNLPAYLQEPVAGQNGLINQATGLLNYQMNGPVGTPRTTAAAKKKRSLLG